MGSYTNADIIRGILEKRSKVFTFLYEEYLPMIQNFIVRNNGDETDAKDLFQDTIIIIYKKVNSGELKLTSSFKTYFYAICKYLWLQRLEKLRKTEILDRQDDSGNDAIEISEYLDYEEEKLYQKHFKMLDDDCQKVLEGYFERKSFKALADDLKFRPSYIKKLKFNCKVKLIRSIMNDPVYFELMDHKFGMATQNKINGQSPLKGWRDNNLPKDILNNDTEKRNK